MSLLAQIISDRLKRKGTIVHPALVELILKTRDDTLTEDETGPDVRFKQTKRVRGGKIVRDDDSSPPF